MQQPNTLDSQPVRLFLNLKKSLFVIQSLDNDTHCPFVISFPMNCTSNLFFNKTMQLYLLESMFTILTEVGYIYRFRKLILAV